MSAQDVERLIRRRFSYRSNRAWFPSLVCFLWCYGCRVSEALNMKREHFRVETLPNGEHNLVAHVRVLKRKDKFEHDVRVNIEQTGPLKHVLKRVLATPRGAYVWGVSRQQVWRTLKQLNVGVKTRTYYKRSHFFRFNRTNALCRKRPTPFELADWMGWKRIDTAQHYLAQDGSLASRFADQID